MKIKESINPDYRVLLPELEPGAETFDLNTKQKKSLLNKNGPHRAAPLDKKVPVHEQASTCGALVDIYPDAISIGGVLGSDYERGNIAFGAWMMIVLTAINLYGASVFGIASLVTWFFSMPVVLFLSLVTVYLFKMAYFAPKDTPVIFNKKTRSVVFSQFQLPNFWKVWLPMGFSKPITVPWATIQARSYKFTQYMGATLRDSYRLEIWAPDPDYPSRLLVKEPIGYMGSYEDEKLWRLYEHIRRYMEEGGSAIQNGETLRQPGRGRCYTPFPDSVFATVGGEPLSADEVKHLAENTPTQHTHC